MIPSTILRPLGLSWADLLSYSRELHHVEGLVVGGGTLVNVDDHGRLPSAAEKGLEEFGQLALPEGDVGALHPDGKELVDEPYRTGELEHSKGSPPVGLVVAEGGDALSQDVQRVVDVARLLQPLSKRLGFVAPLRASEVTQRKPSGGGPDISQTQNQEVKDRISAQDLL